MEYSELISKIVALVNDDILPDCAFIGKSKTAITKQDEVLYRDITIEFDIGSVTSESEESNLKTRFINVFGIQAGTKYSKTDSGVDKLTITIPVAHVFKGVKPEHKRATGPI